MLDSSPRLRRPAKNTPQLLLTPLIDVLLVLICFVLSVSFQIQAAVDVNLPDARTGELVTTDTLTISLLRDSTLVLQGQTVSPEGFSAALQQKLRSRPGTAPTSAVLQGDEDIPYALLISVMDSLRAQGITDISLLTNSRGGRP